MDNYENVMLVNISMPSINDATSFFKMSHLAISPPHPLPQQGGKGIRVLPVVGKGSLRIVTKVNVKSSD